MRLSPEAFEQIKPLIVNRQIECEYHDKTRRGTVESIGEGPNGAFITVHQTNGEFRNFSLNKIDNLRSVL